VAEYRSLAFSVPMFAGRDGTARFAIDYQQSIIHQEVPSPMPADTTLTCRDCGQAFIFTSGEQDFYAARGYSEPSRCADCRAARKAERGFSGGSYSSYGSSGGGGGGGGYGRSGGGGRGAREMFSATCSSCGKEAQVPFQPSGDKPVYCSDCFQQRGGGNRGGGYGRGRR
jgi:CxxC-x17-CxxC domain-containing protein